MKKIIYSVVIVFSILTVAGCDRKTNEATEKKKDGPVFELKEEVQAPKSDTTVIEKDSTDRK